MIKNTIHKLVRKNHHWRDVKFDELSEIYTSMTLRSLGFSIIGVFVPIYLYLNGVSMYGICMFFTFFFLARAIIAPWIGAFIGRFGPKHAIATSTFIFIAFLLLLLTYSTYQWNLYLMSAIYTLSNGLFFIATSVDFSKIQHNKHGGKELGWLYIFERIGSAAGPFTGGLIASFISPEVTILFAIIMLILSLVPLFMTAEPVKTHQEVSFKTLDISKIKNDIFAQAGFSVSHVSYALVWPLYIAVFIFTENVYATLGTIVAASMLISLVSAHYSGKLIDSKRAFYIFRFGSFVTLTANLIRPFITTTAGAVAVTTLEEPTSISVKMAVVKGTFERADNLEGNRIAYLTYIEMCTAIAKGLFIAAITVLIVLLGEQDALRYGFIIGALSVPLLTMQRFPNMGKPAK